MSELVLVANSEDATISTLRMHTGREPLLESLATTPVGGSCSTFVIDSERDVVYAAYKGDSPGVVKMRLDRETGTLTPVWRSDVDASLTYLTLAAGGSLLLGASYGGGFGAVWRVEPNGLGLVTDRIEYDNLHCVVVVGDIVYFVSLGQDLIAQYRLGPNGKLHPLAPETVPAPPGSGPRHLIVNGADAYLLTEFSGEAIRYDVAADGGLTEAESVVAVDPAAGLTQSRFGADPIQEGLIWGADLHLAEGYLLCSERNSSTIASIAVDAEGDLGHVAAITSTEKQPRGFGVAPDGRHVVGVGEKSKRASLYHLEDDGSLTLLHRQHIGDGANWVRFVL